MIDGDIAAHNVSVSYRKHGTTLAVATIGRDVAALGQRPHPAGWA